MMTRAQKIAKNKIDKQIEQIVYRRCNRVPIDIMKISDVYKAGYAAVAAGADLESAVVAKYGECAGVAIP